MELSKIDDLLLRAETIMLSDRPSATGLINDLCVAIRWLMVQIAKETGDDSWSI